MAAVLVAVVALALGGCAGTTAPVGGGPPVTKRSGELLLVNSYVQQPRTAWAAVGSDLALYGWLFNKGVRDDALLSVSSPYAAEVRVVGGVALPTTLPAQGWTTFEPFGRYLVLAGLTRRVVAGSSIPIVFRFADNPPLRVRVLALERPSVSTPPPGAPNL